MGHSTNKNVTCWSIIFKRWFVCLITFAFFFILDMGNLFHKKETKPRDYYGHLKRASIHTTSICTYRHALHYMKISSLFIELHNLWRTFTGMQEAKVWCSASHSWLMARQWYAATDAVFAREQSPSELKADLRRAGLTPNPVQGSLWPGQWINTQTHFL